MKLITGIVVSVFLSSSGFGQELAADNDSLCVEIQSDTSDVSMSDSLLTDTLPLRKAQPNGAQIDALISYAKTFLGTPYRYAGTSPSGFDCSGFIYHIFGNFGISVTRTSYSLAELGQTVKLADLRPGDLMFFKGRNVNSTSVGHVSLVVEVNENEIRMIHASSSRGVVIDNFKTSKYYIPRFIKAKRLDYGVTE